MNIKPWIQSMRLRTIPLAISGILLSISLILREGKNPWVIFVFALFTAISLQIISNFANDYGDFIKGTDSKANRTDRMLAAGKIESHSMKLAIRLLSIVTFILGFFMIYYSYQNAFLVWSDFFIILAVGIMAIASAIFYTVGKRAYGYLGLGDVFVFLFFGIVPVWGLHLLTGTYFNLNALLPCIGLGLLCVGVLNTNNFRDIISDSSNNKNTIAVKLGKKRTQYYQLALICIGFGIILVSEFSFIKSQNSSTVYLFLYLPSLILLINHLFSFTKYSPGMRPELNRELKRLSLTVLLTVLVHYFVGIIIL